MKKVEQVISLCTLVLKRLVNHVGLSICSAIGILSILSLVICVPVFANGVLSQVLKDQLSEKAALNRRSLFSLHLYYNDNPAYTPLELEHTETVSQYIRSRLEGTMGLELDDIIVQVTSRQFTWRPVKYKSTTPMFKSINLSFMSSNELSEKLKVVEGSWPQAVSDPTAPIPVAVLEGFADTFFLNMGDIYETDGVRIEIVGILRAIDEHDPAWFYTPKITLNNAFWVPMEFFEQRLPGIVDTPLNYSSWYAIVKDSSLRFSESLSYTREMIRLENDLQTMMPAVSIDYSPSDMLTAYEDRLNSMIILFYAAGAPVLMLALIFIGMTASIAVRQYEQETAVMGARGGTSTQFIFLNLVESLVLIVMMSPLAFLLGWGASILMGQTQLFLQFTRRSGFTFTLNDVNFAWLGLAVLAIGLARLAPRLTQPLPSILTLKQEHARGGRKPFWERYYLDLLLFIPTAYAYLRLRGQAQAGSQVESTAAQSGYDPLMFLASSLFVIALCLLALRLFPIMLRILASLTSRLSNAWIFLAVQEIARNPRQHTSALLLIMISLSFSTFTASMANTLEHWLRDSEYYRVGADLAVKEYERPSESSFAPVETGAEQPDETQAMEAMISLERHLQQDDIQAATYVGKFPCTFSLGGFQRSCTVMGIDRLTFPQTAFYRSDFADISLGGLMNALAAQPLGVLIPRSLAEERGLQVGDRIKTEVLIGISGELVVANLFVAGIYSYFPTVYPGDDPTLIANLEELFGGPDAITGVEVWLRLQPGAQVSTVLDRMKYLASREWLMVEVQGDALTKVQKGMSQPEWVGLFGVLNVGFLLTGLLPAIGFILYSFASLQKRLIQFGILQALGLSTPQVEGSLALEQILLMSLALAGGAIIGFATSALFLPFMQVGLAGVAPTPPFAVLLGWNQAAWLCLIFVAIFLISLAGMMISLARLKIITVMKMGEAV